ncbi:CGNR zinc finger domain-containing protein [Planosporangium sp. 12N6]|uniref:CGNR zinc finger domain-containing protein n=1 Tax=Planosporangium spinosum TaxID=3402278 RepID=UPI003CE720AB
MAPFLLTPPDGPPFPFDAGAPCLELLLSGGGEDRRGYGEALHAPRDLVHWCARGSLDLAGHGVDPAEVTATTADLTMARRLREAVRHSGVRASRGDRPDPEDLAVINQIAAGRGVVAQVDPDTGRLVWRRPVTGHQLLVHLARDAVATFSTPTVSRVRRCAGPGCGLLYLDTSRPGRRRWCSMRRCGNRNKTSGYRSRRAATSDGPPERAGAD